MKILFPTDFSEVSLNAFVYALHLADSLKAELITLHVYEFPILQMDSLPTNLKEVYDTIELEKFENFKDQIPLLHAIAKEEHLEHIPWSNVMKHGDLIWAINAISIEESIDYIVMGTKGASGLKATFLGSNTGTVITESDAFVIAIPEIAKFTGIKNITFTTRFREKDKKALDRIIAIAHSLQASIQCLYIKTNKSDNPLERISEWKTAYEKENIHFHIIEKNDVQSAILEFVEEHQSDLLAMLNYKRGFFEELFNRSLTQKLSYHSKIPILAFHESKLD